MVDLRALIDDLQAEHGELDDILDAISDDAWDTLTPAPGWSIRDQVSHLAFFDEQASMAVAEPGEFAAALSRATGVDQYIEAPVERGRSIPPGSVLEWWRVARSAMVAAFGSAEPTERVPWFGPPMSLASFISARLMETWAHGQDVFDALGLDRVPTDRLKHVAHLGVRARPNSYAANGRTVPEGEVRVELRSPSGDTWSWNESASDRVGGDAVDFCLVVTQRRHLDDTDLVVEGPLAQEWMSIAQCFAGPPGEGRRPGQFPKAGAR